MTTTKEKSVCDAAFGACAVLAREQKKIRLDRAVAKILEVEEDIVDAPACIERNLAERLEAAQAEWMAAYKDNQD